MVSKTKTQKRFRLFIHIFYIIGIIYAFFFYITSSKQHEMYNRRLWAIETWIIFTFYMLFIWIFYLSGEQEKGTKKNRSIFIIVISTIILSIAISFLYSFFK